MDEPGESDMSTTRLIATIPIGGNNVQIFVADQETVNEKAKDNKGNNFGVYVEDPCSIYILEGQSEENFSNTLIHELVEEINAAFYLRLGEMRVRILENCIAQIIRNPEAMRLLNP